MVTSTTKITRLCAGCSIPIINPAAAQKYCSKQCNKQCNKLAVAASHKKYAQTKGKLLLLKKKQAGICTYCSVPALENKRYCLKHQRKNTEYAHKANHRISWYDGVKTSPKRTPHFLTIIKTENPILDAHWKEVEIYISENIDNWIDKTDTPLFKAINIELLNNFDNQLISSYYSRRGHIVSFEDYMIEKIDYQRASRE